MQFLRTENISNRVMLKYACPVVVHNIVFFSFFVVAFYVFISFFLNIIFYRGLV
jgi:hypothetical protein